MRTMSITITDYHNLVGLIEMALLKNKTLKVVKTLRDELKNAKRVSQVSIPRNIITMNSRVLLRERDSDRQLIITLTYPHNADPAKNKVSVFSPQGASLLGAEEGETITWEVPDGQVFLIVKKVLYQPEAEGHYHL